jgi:hypothetical protein
MSVRLLLAFASLLSALALPGPAAATILRPFDLAALSREAQAVVRGRVVSQESVRDEPSGRIYTHSAVEVLEVVKGPVLAPDPRPGVAPRVVVRQMGGTIGDETMTVPGTADVQVGEEVVLFLRTDERFGYLVGMHQGKYGVRRDDAGAWVTRAPLPRAAVAPAATAAPDTGGRAILPAGALAVAPDGDGSPGADRVALDEWLATVRRHVAAAAAAPPTTPGTGASTVAP